MEEQKGFDDSSMACDEENGSSIFLFGALKGHSDAIRCLDAISDMEWNGKSESPDEYYIFSGARDSSVMVWSEDLSVANAQPDIAYRFGSWVYSLAAFVPQTAKESSCAVGLAVGLQSGQIELMLGDHPLRFPTEGRPILEGHSAPVCSLKLQPTSQGDPMETTPLSGQSEEVPVDTPLSSTLLLLSGAWDDTARVWDLDNLSCLYVLGGHENNVCVLGLPNGQIVTGSTGLQVEGKIIGYQLRLWQDGKVLKTNEDHQSGIRELCAVNESDTAFASASNDGTVRLFSNQLEGTEVFAGPDGSFIYSVAYLGDGRFAAGQESGNLLIMKRGYGILQTIRFSKSLWAVCCLPNKDFVAAGEDNALIIFTTCRDRALSQECLDRILGQNLIQKDRTYTEEEFPDYRSGVKPESELVQYRGSQEGEISLFQDCQNKVTAYRWVNGSWQKVGSVTEPVKREELDGVFYDMVLPVEVDSASKGFLSLMMGFNFDDCPDTKAREFCLKYDLSEEYHSQISTFVSQYQAMASL
mmetsp:Transcript_31494/g.40488  ORF Transcript_31494/g.40488 Transcript_31494/m.40488 type:complete len:526 (+) Transcript_31494:217-1794(+)|eukprot:CAMPEP_0117740384 /NCGR_PEP_ID=MMETSP0947-20121206/4312_1 /TAXON_ID=44440 /ORGANISM="Chattonella subsalsa, Strain CCMP2191" /LENGTH=525 /DNA_ID=CAMNT_0005556493 /DNA_START=102 /DNA_END=1679 /DNA_ORIENTATION=-